MRILSTVFPEFQVDPYYEPLVWCMMYLYIYIYIYNATVDKVDYSQLTVLLCLQYGKTPLELAVDQGYQKIVDFLVKRMDISQLDVVSNYDTTFCECVVIALVFKAKILILNRSRY